jgi:DNA replication protein DnaC
MEARDLTRTTSLNGRDHQSKCPICQGTTWIPIPDDPDGRVKQCQCQKIKIAAIRIQVILQDWPEYLNARLESYAPRSAGQVNALTAIRGDPHGSFFFTGKYSHGKTHLMIAQYRHLALAGGRCILRSARDLMEELRKAEAPADSNREVFESPVLQMVNLAPAGHLFIDDIEKAGARSEFRAEMIFDLLDTIKRRQLGITVTSNLPLQDLAPKIGDAATARLHRLCREIEL